MTRILTLLLSTLILSACVSSTDRSIQANVAQALKTEGDIFLSQGQYTAALSRLLEAQKGLSDDPLLYNSLGLAYMGKKRDDLAESAFQKALNLKPGYAEATNNLGAVYLRREKWDLAIATFTGLLDDLLYPTPHYPLSNIGWAYLGKKDFQKAELYFGKALDLFPGFITASHGLSQTYIQAGRIQTALSYLNVVLKRSPESFILHADMAQAYEMNNDNARAIESWKMVRRYAPKNSILSRKAEQNISELK